MFMLISSLFFGMHSVGENSNAKIKNANSNNKECNREVSLELSEVVNNTKYPKSKTVAKEWKKGKDRRYNYPIDCNSDEWLKYENHIQMLEACTVPDSVIENATTEELLDLVYDYPLLGDIYAYNSNEEGMVALANQCNAFGELIKREDVCEVALQRYEDIDIVDATDDSEKNFDIVSEVVVLEAILAQQDIVEDLTMEEQGKLADMIEKNLQEKQQTELFQENLTTFYEIAQQNGVAESINLEECNINQYEDVTASSTTYVKTPNGTKVTVLVNSYNGSAWAEAVDAQYEQMYPAATKLRASDNRYNCHSYAWYSTATSNKYWMNNPKAYVTDGSYKYVGEAPTAKSQKVVYKYQCGVTDKWIHSGIAVNTTGKIKSKWGQAPLMKHALAYCPYYGQYNVVHYYKKG